MVVQAAANAVTLQGAAGYLLKDTIGRSTVPRLPLLQNRYFALRHGQSVANMEGIISSDPAVGTVKHGLTTSGKVQARVAATQLIEAVGREALDDLIFISSDFTRARETAEECRAAVVRITEFEREERAVSTLLLQVIGETFECPPAVIRQELRERYFGELDGTVLLNYNKVWPADLIDSRHAGYGVESVQDVCARMQRLFLSLEEQYAGKCMVLTSHADTLQIMQCYVAGADERLFSQYRFKNGEVRALLQEQTSLPPPKPLSYN
ncbi:histidine phosphatase superfamily [Tribonema minus]|uniref:Histidine phosphatase superfamily n=1 Tax=Tribonema minus TaxID=303371 RepID=A0A836CKV0_9STRA|nr:histidine phosphatase superfamily [Tribonema minus]